MGFTQKRKSAGCQPFPALLGCVPALVWFWFQLKHAGMELSCRWHTICIR